ncbi:MAG: FHA domain-containing protein [Gaiellaceae bacterium]|jgi:pSer/pThr/pTyr-binding forkhead associated (FHA) protein
MSVEPVLLALKAAFFVLLYLFIWRVIRTAARDLRTAPQESFVLAPSQLGAEPATSPGGRLVVQRSDVLKTGTAFEAGAVPISIGRAEDNDVALEGDEFASSHHARVESNREGVWVLDLNSTNGTFVNGSRLDGRRRLREGDVVQIGETELKFEQ